MRLLGIAGEPYRVGRCACGARVKLSRKAEYSECLPCGSVYENLTGRPATAWLLEEMGHR